MGEPLAAPWGGVGLALSLHVTLLSRDLEGKKAKGVTLGMGIGGPSRPRPLRTARGSKAPLAEACYP